MGSGGRWQLRRQVKRGGFATRREAEAALAALVDGVAGGTATHDTGLTVEAYLLRWLEAKEASGLRPTTLRSYRQHVRTHLAPTIGHLRLGELRHVHVEEALALVMRPTDSGRPPAGPATVQRVRATLRSALASAKRRRLVAFNAATDLELPKVTRPRVVPWDPAELGAFLDHAVPDRLGVLFEVMAATGLRRGEALGLRWIDLDTPRGVITVRQQVLQVEDGRGHPCPSCEQGHRGIAFGPPKTASGDHRLVDLDSATLDVLLEHRLRQDVEKALWADAYNDHGLVFAREDGTPVQPNHVTTRFAELTASAGLRRIRLHDLRHGQASLMLAAGVPIAVVSKRLGHSSITLTSDTYSHLLPGVGRDAAERAAALVPRRRDQDRDHRVTTSSVPGGSRRPRGREGAGQTVGPVGLEPTTRGLKVRCSAS